MKLTGTVIQVISGSRFTSGKRHVVIRFSEADWIDNTIQVPSELFQLDDRITATLKVEQDVVLEPVQEPGIDTF